MDLCCLKEKTQFAAVFFWMFLVILSTITVYIKPIKNSKEVTFFTFGKNLAKASIFFFSLAYQEILL